MAGFQDLVDAGLVFQVKDDIKFIFHHMSVLLVYKLPNISDIDRDEIESVLKRNLKVNFKRFIVVSRESIDFPYPHTFVYIEFGKRVLSTRSHVFDYADIHPLITVVTRSHDQVIAYITSSHHQLHAQYNAALKTIAVLTSQIHQLEVQVPTPLQRILDQAACLDIAVNATLLDLSLSDDRPSDVGEGLRSISVSSHQPISQESVPTSGLPAILHPFTPLMTDLSTNLPSPYPQIQVQPYEDPMELQRRINRLQSRLDYFTDLRIRAVLSDHLLSGPP